MTESDFLVTLPSNSNMSTHPSNEPANYSVKLAEPLQLDGDWEAALVSVQYTPNWRSFKSAIHILAVYSNIHLSSFSSPEIYNMTNTLYHNCIRSSALVSVVNELRKDTAISDLATRVYVSSPNEVIALSVITLMPKYYESVEALGREICKLVQDAFHSESFTMRYIYDADMKRGQFKIYNGAILLVVDGQTNLGDLLGHPTEKIDCNCKQHQRYLLHNHGMAEPKLPRVSSLWIYSNITQNQQVGDSKVPLLGIIPSQSDDRKRVHYTVNPVHFQALNRNHISEISIQIVDDRGNRIPFTKGENEDNLVCCLRFRRRKTPMPI